MAEQTTLSAIGLQTSANELGSVPAGGLTKAENCVLLGPGLIGPRRGQKTLAYAPTGEPHAAFIYDEALIVQHDTDKLARDTGSAFADYSGAYEPPDATLLRMKAVEAQGNLYFTTSKGIRRLDGLARTPALAGGPVARDILSAAVNATAAGFLPALSSVAYRLVLGTKDANGIVHLGPPSGRAEVTNTSSTTAFNVGLSFTTVGIDSTEVFWQLYRSKTTPSTRVVDGASEALPPGDEMYLVTERYVTSDEITAGTISFTDTVPDAFLGVRLYSNETDGDPENGQNFAPPLAHDLAWFADRMWYANTRRLQSVDLQIIGVGEGADGATGVRLGDTLKVGGLTLVAWGTESAGVTFKVTSNLDAEANIVATAKSLVNAINTATGPIATYRAFYVSSPDDAPGKVRIEAKNYDNPQAFEVVLTTYAHPLPLGAITRLADVATVTTSDPHGFAVGDVVNVNPTGAADPVFSTGARTVTSTPTDTTFTFALLGGAASSTEPYTAQRRSPVPQYAWNPPPPPSWFGVASGGLIRSGGIVFATADRAHGLYPGAVIAIEPVDTADANFPAGTKTVASVVNSLVFTYSEAGSNGASTVAYQSGARVTSTDDAQPHGIAYSKVQMPEAVPLLNTLPIGIKDSPILRIVPLRSYLFVFKPEGVYLVSEENTVNLLDDTVRLYSPDSAIACENRVFALTNSGVVAVTQNGVQTVSLPIDQELQQYFGAALADVKVDAFALSHDTDRLYSLWLPAISGAAAPYNAGRAYVLSTLANAWTTWELPRTCGVIRSSDDALFMGKASGIVQGRNTRTTADFADDESTVNVLGWNANTLTMAVASTSGIAAGDVVRQGGTTAIVTSVPSGTTLVLNEGPFTPATAASRAYMVSGASGTITATINGVPASVAASGGDTATAVALAAAINLLSGSMGVTADTLFTSVIVTAITPGAAGNAITTTASGTGLTAAGPTLTGGADSNATVLYAFPVSLKWRAFAPSSPADMKLIRELHAHWRHRSFRQGQFKFTTDLVTSPTTVAAAGDFDSITYPGAPIEPKKSRLALPHGLMRGNYLNVEWELEEALGLWTLNGITLVYEPVSEKGHR